MPRRQDETGDSAPSTRTGKLRYTLASLLMAATVITVSPRESLARLELLVRTRLDRDGVAVLAGNKADRRQRQQLRRIRARLAADPELDVYFGDRPDGTSQVTVFRAGKHDAGWWGEPVIG